MQPQTLPTGYGAASRYDFDNPNKWHTIQSVPVLDEHEMTDENGRPVAYVDAGVLQEIAGNNNRRVRETGDPAPLIIGHTSDDPKAPEKPVAGYAINYRVKPFKRDESGRVVYAIHVDYKLRRQYATAAEDFPRRSVELWWSKKELDPIALLGGTTPERDLGVIVRKARLKAVSLLGGSTPARDLGVMVRYDRKSNGTVFDYNIIEPIRNAAHGQGKVGKVMHEFKHGELHSGSKHGPKVTSRDQAVAIAMNEAGKSKAQSKDKHARYEGGDMGTHHLPNPKDASLHYGDDEGPETDDLPPDENDESGFDDGGGDEDPLLAKVFASKQWQDMQSTLDEIKQAIMGDAGEGAPPGGDGMGAPPPGGPPMDAPGGDPPGPGGTDLPGGDAPMGEEMGRPDEEAAEFHGAPPVRFESTGFAGPTSGMIPGMQGRRAQPYSRPGQKGKPMSRSATADSPEVIKMARRVETLERSNRNMALKLARAETEKIVNQLEAVDGIDFSDETGQNADQNKQATINFLSTLDDQSRNFFINNTIKKHYKRRQPDPAYPSYPGVAHYGRIEVPEGSDPNDYTPPDAQSAVRFAEMQARGMSLPDAIKAMRNGHR